MAPGGRSTGCKTCRMRHLKCDEARPTCQRCEKAGVECRGYDVIDVFVDERMRILERGSKPKAERRKPSDLPLSHRPKGVKASRKHLPAPASSSSLSTPVNPRAGSTRRIVSPLPAIMPIQEDDIYLNFMRNRLLSKIPAFRLNQRAFMTSTPLGRPGWLLPAISRGNMQAPLKPAVNALTRAWFGKIQDDQNVAAQGMIEYGKALNELKVALLNGRWRGRDVLVSAMCLILYEAITFTNSEAWVSHARGLAQLIEAQGPESFQDALGLGLLRAMRFSIIMSSWAREMPVFLEREEWCTVPWQSHPSVKDDNDLLFEIYASIPGLAHKIRAWEKGDRTKDSTPVLEDVLAKLHETIQWRWSYEMVHPSCAWIEDFEPVEPTSLFPYTLHFASSYDLQVIGVYDGLLIVLLRFCSRLTDQEVNHEQMLPKPPGGLVKSNPLVLPGVDELDPMAIAREICQVIRFRISYMYDNAIAFGLFMPIRMAWQVLKDNPEDEQWIAGIATQFERTSGVQFSKLAFWGINPRSWAAR